MGKAEYLSAGDLHAGGQFSKRSSIKMRFRAVRTKRRGDKRLPVLCDGSIETFDVIGMLWELGMPLAEIRNYLEQQKS